MNGAINLHQNGQGLRLANSRLPIPYDGALVRCRPRASRASLAKGAR